MPAVITNLGLLGDWLARVGDSAETAACVQVTVDTEVGVPSRTHATGDHAAAAYEVAASLFQHLLEATRDPTVRSFLLDCIGQIGLSV